MKVRGSDDPEDGKNHEDKDSQGKAEDQVEEKDSSTVPTLKEDQDDGVLNSQSESRDPFHTEEVEQHSSTTHVAQGQVDRIEPPNDPTATSPPTQVEVAAATAGEGIYRAILRQNIATIQVRIDENRVKIAEIQEQFCEGFWKLSNRQSRPKFWGSVSEGKPEPCPGNPKTRHPGKPSGNLFTETRP